MSHFLTITPSRPDFTWCWFLRSLGTQGAAVERLLYDIGVMDHSGWIDRAPSVLTKTGAPAQINFRTDSDALCVTIDATDPANRPDDPVSHMCHVMSSLGMTLPGSELLQIIAIAQDAGPLTYGACLEVDQTDDQRNIRLLAELPAQPADLLSPLMPKACAALNEIGKQMRLTMLGFDGTSGAVTLHGEITDATRHCLPPLCDIAKVQPDFVAAAIDGLTNRIPTEPLAVDTLCFSLTTTPDSQPPQLSVFLDAQQALGRDEAISARILACGGHRMPGYAALLAQMDPAPPGVTHHAQIGLTARAGAVPVLSVGLAAPWQSYGYG